MTATSKKLTPPQQRILIAALAYDGKLERWPGGFWAPSDATFTWGRNAPGEKPYKVPDGHVGVASVRALERMGYLERVGSPLPAWRDPRQLTVAGRQVAAAVKGLSPSR